MASRERVLAAIDVGTNAVRLELARLRPDGSLETLHQERDPIRPGEGVFATGRLAPPVVDRLVATLARYAAVCERHGARVRAVATSALRDAANGEAVARRAARETGLTVEILSGGEEARLIGLGVLQGQPRGRRALVVDIGGGSTEVIAAVGEEPTALHSVPVGSVRLTELFGGARVVSKARLAGMTRFAAEALRDALAEGLPHVATALGSSGTVHAIVAARGDAGRLTLARAARAVEELAAMPIAERRRRFEPRRAEIVVAGAVILEAVMRQLGLVAVVAVRRGLREGVLLDLSRR